MSANGINLPQLGSDSLLRYERDFFFAPEAANKEKVVASVDPSGLTVGTACSLAANVSGKALRRARRITLSCTDASGGAGGLVCTVRVIGARWGVFRDELLTVTCTDGNETSSTSVGVFDEITSVTPTLLTSAAAGDALKVGIDGTSFGLDFPIDVTSDVISIINTSTNTEAAPTAVSTTTVDTTSGAGGSFVKGLTLATTDRWEVRYLKSRRQDMSGVIGVWR